MLLQIACNREFLVNELIKLCENILVRTDLNGQNPAQLAEIWRISLYIKKDKDYILK